MGILLSKRTFMLKYIIEKYLEKSRKNGFTALKKMHMKRLFNVIMYNKEHCKENKSNFWLETI